MKPETTNELLEAAREATSWLNPDGTTTPQAERLARAIAQADLENRAPARVRLRARVGDGGERFALIDEGDAERARAYEPWGVARIKVKNAEGEIVETEVAVTTKGGLRLFLHRLVTGATLTEKVTFRNANGLDCRRENLVVVKR